MSVFSLGSLLVWSAPPVEPSPSSRWPRTCSYSGTRAFLDPAADANGPEVDVSTLDGAIDELRLGPPDLVKIDVEGAGLDVVVGVSETLRPVSPRVLIAIHDDRKDPRREMAICDLLDRFGSQAQALHAA